MQVSSDENVYEDNFSDEALVTTFPSLKPHFCSEEWKTFTLY